MDEPELPDDLLPIGTLLREHRTARSQTLVADAALTLVVCIAVLCSVVVLTAAAEHAPASLLPLVACSFVVFYMLGSSEWRFSELGGCLQDHQPLLTLVSYWMLWELLVCSPSIWDAQEKPTVWRTTLHSTQPLFQLLLYVICLSPLPQKARIVLLICITPFIRNDGLSTDELFQAFQCCCFLFNYTIDFMLSRLSGSGNSALQASWCLVLARPLPLIAGTVGSLCVRLVSLVWAQKSHIN